MSISRNTVAIIGVGNVGSAVAYGILNHGICDDVYLVDKNFEKAKSEAIDLENSIEFLNRNMKVYAKNFEDLGNVDVVVLAASAPYKEEETRLQMFESSKKIIDSVVPKIMASGFDGIFVVITNPVDIMSYYVHKLSGLPKSRVIGTGTALDSARLKNFLSEITKVDPRSIHGFTMGEHGDSQMIPWSVLRIGGKLWSDILVDNPSISNKIEKIDSVREKITKMGWKIMEHKGSTNYGIASTTVGIIKAIMHDENKIIPVSTYLDGEYGINDIFISVPSIINKSGVKEVVEIKMTDEEWSEFNNSVSVIKQYIEKL